MSEGVELYGGSEANTGLSLELTAGARGLIKGDPLRVRQVIHNLQCMVSDPVEEVVRFKEDDVSEDIASIQEYLSYLKPHRVADYSTWLQVGMALHSVSEDPELLQLWDNWSQTDSKYNEGECERKWLCRRRASRSLHQSSPYGV